MLSGVFLGKSQDKWDQNIQQIAMAIRASVNRSTGFNPNRLMLGREVNTPAQLMFPNARENRADEYGEYVSKLLSNLQRAHNVARSLLKTSLKRMKRNYDLKGLLRPYSEGDVVYLLDTAVTKGKSRKLCSPWKGPAVIVKKLSAYLYRVKLRKAIFVTNHDRMMPCRDRNLPAWITKFKESPDHTEDFPQAENSDEEVYCTCRSPWGGRFMIQCDYCDESCVNVSVTDALNIDKYKCRACKDNTPAQ